MSGIIQLLPDNIANQIAAGEVIQRPASVIKELMENAIDAGADKIDVNIKDAGKTLIQIVDNGCGMSPEDAIKCWERHATSKLRSSDDLFSLTTKGFRGEALASVAAIAHVEMKTRREEDITGRHIRIEGNEITANDETVCPVGTSFEVKNLFYNVPARRNFLKSNSVEFGHIQEEFERIALAHPDVHMSLHHNDNEIYNLHAAILRKRIVDLIGKQFNDRLVPIEEHTDIVQLKGFVLKPEFARKTRGEQFLFVNDRFFKSSYFNHAIGKAFEGLIQDKFPGYFLYMHVDPSKIDVNVHPTKTEIKFEEEKFIYAILLSSVRQALGKYNIAPTLDFERETGFDIPQNIRLQTPVEPVIKVNPEYNPFDEKRSMSYSSSGSSGKSQDNFSKAIVAHGFGSENHSPSDWENFYKIEEISSDAEGNGSIVQTELLNENEIEIKSEFIIRGNYIFAPSKSGLMVIHYRRALEQIIYTSIHNTFIIKPIDSQSMLFPYEKEISRQEGINWEENRSILKQLGFDAEISDNLLLVKAVPEVIQDETLEDALNNLLEIINHKEIDKGDLAHSVILSIARSASLKKVNLNSGEQIHALIDQLFQCENHIFTPGNKKIVETLDLASIDQKFK